MSYELRNEVVGALSLTPSQQETADLIGWHTLRAHPDLSPLAARYFPQFGVTQISQKHLDDALASGREDLILAVLLHERAHQFVGMACGDYEAHGALFAGICWGLQARAGVRSDSQAYDIQDEPSDQERAARIAGAIADAPDTTAAVRLIGQYVSNKKSDNRIEAVGGIGRMLLIVPGVLAVELILSGNGGILLGMFFH